MLELSISVILAVLVSFFCSISEAMLLSVSWSHIEHLRKSGRNSGEILFRLRNDVEKPITAILTLNTTAATVGATVSGALAADVFGHAGVGWFALAFTLLILSVSEIIPKTLGVMYNRPLSTALARPLQLMVWALYPVIAVSSFFMGFIARRNKGPHHSEEDLRALVSLTRRAGVIEPYEEMIIKNVLALDNKRVQDIMTPRTVVFSLPGDLTVAEAWTGREWTHSRVPVYDVEDSEDIVGVVYRSEVLESLAADRDDIRLSDLMRPARFVLETITLDRLLAKLLESRMHMFVVLDEYGGVTGVVTLEDVVEEILGKEIVGETDKVTDMREFARRQRDMLVKGKLD